MASDTGNSSSDLGGKSQLVEEDSSNLGGSTSSTNWDWPPRYDITPGESDSDEMGYDYVADLPLVRNFN